MIKKIMKDAIYMSKWAANEEWNRPNAMVT